MIVMEDIINLVNDYNLLEENGLLVLEYSNYQLDSKYANLSLVKNKKYGNKFVSIYRKAID